MDKKLIFFIILQAESIKIQGGQEYGYYFVDVFFGPNKQVQSLIIDTGSNQLITDCAPCDSCGKHLHPPYDITLSKTATSPSGFLGFKCQDDCGFEVSYLEGSQYSGKRFRELVSFDGSDYFDMIIGCADKETNLFYSQKADGIVGLGFDSLF